MVVVNGSGLINESHSKYEIEIEKKGIESLEETLERDTVTGNGSCTGRMDNNVASA